MLRLIIPTDKSLYLWGPLFLVSLVIPFDPLFLHVWGILIVVFILFSILDFSFLLSPNPVSIQREVPEFMGRHASSEMILQLKNHQNRTLKGILRQNFDPDIEVQKSEHPFFIPPLGSVTLPISFLPRKRGEQRALETTLRILSPLSLWQKQIVFKKEDPFLVLPNLRHLLPARGLLAPRLSALGVKRMKRKGIGTEFDSLRRYVDGDTYRDIDWRATSKRGQLMTRTYQVERNHEILIGIDCGRLMGTTFEGLSKLDWIIDSALNVASFALRQKDSVGLFLFGSKPRGFLPPKRDASQITRISRMLARAKLEKKETHFLSAATYLSSRRSKRLLVILFTDFLDRETSLGLISGLFHLNKRHCILFVAVEDPHIPSTIESPVTKEVTPFHKGTAFEMKKNRLEVLDLLEKASMTTLDLHPKALTPPVLLNYLDLKLSRRL